MDVSARDQIKQIVYSIEDLEEDKAMAARLISEVYLEAKEEGFDVTALRKVVALRKKSAQKQAEEAAALEMYLEALGGSQ